MSDTKQKLMLPWMVSEMDPFVVCPVSNPKFGVFTTSDLDEQDDGDPARISFMVRAANNHHALLEACKMALGAFERNDCIDWNVLAQAIAAAEREEDGNEK